MIKFMGIFTIAMIIAQFNPAHACDVNDRLCALSVVASEASKIENANWRDQTYRELAKSYAFEGLNGQAMALLDKIQNPDTKALTIRGIGMASAGQDISEEQHAALFESLRAHAEKIDHPPSYAIALTYIAMAQAFAGDNEGAWKTASDMENDALRHKAYGETAEIQAEKGDFTSAMKSIGFIESAAFRNKAYAIVSKLLADQEHFQNAFDAAAKITNSYKKAQAIQNVLNTQKPQDVKHKQH